MKKITLLSIVASAYLFAGGALAPVEEFVIPVEDVSSIVVVDVVEKEIPKKIVFEELKDGSYCGPCNHDESVIDGKLSVMGLTGTDFKDYDAFSKETSALTASVELSAEKSFGKFFVGGELSGTISSNEITDNAFALADGSVKSASAAITRGYVGVNITDGTSLKAGRIVLDTPLAFSENWNAIDNTFEAVTVNSDILPRTNVQAGFIKGANSYLDLSTFNELNGDKGMYFISAKSRVVNSIDVSGAYYLMPEQANEGITTALYASASYTGDVVSGAIQGGYIFGDSVVNNTSAVGAELKGDGYGATFRGAVSKVEGSREFRNVAGTKSPLYTQMQFNDMAVVGDNTTYLLEGVKGSYTVAYGLTEGASGSDYKELDLTYAKDYGDIEVLSTYANVDIDAQEDNLHIIRVAARYAF